MQIVIRVLINVHLLVNELCVYTYIYNVNRIIEVTLSSKRNWVTT